MEHSLMQLPYGMDALKPHLSEETLEYHYGKHHANYVKKLNELLTDNLEYQNSSLVDIIKTSSGALFNNAAQVYNHDFYWNGLSPTATKPSANLLNKIEEDFQSIEAFKEQFLSAATNLFGSGWVWLSVDKNKKLLIEKTCNANNPIRSDRAPLLTCDIWEHAYYIDYRNSRANYLKGWWELINWQFVSENFTASEQPSNTQYDKPCNANSVMCDYMNFMQEQERIGS
jgi:superoxide dismutase, Fe-Mn family